MAWAAFAFTVPFTVLLVWYDGIPAIHWQPFLAATLLSFLVNLLAWFLFFKALSLAPVALTIPFTAFTPLFLIPIAYFSIGEVPSGRGIAGIFLIISGAYGLHLNSGSLFKPFRSLFRNKGTRYMLIVSFIWSISATAEKVAVVNSSPAFYGLVIFSLLAIAYLPVIRKIRPTDSILAPRTLFLFTLLGLINGLLLWVQFTALKYLYVSYVIAFKRAGIFVSVLFGAFILKEANPVRNLLFTGLMVLGIFLIM